LDARSSELRPTLSNCSEYEGGLDPLPAPGELANRVLGICDPSVLSLNCPGRSVGLGGISVAPMDGTTISSISLSVIRLSPFSAGLGPRSGNVITFQGHSGGINHCTVSRVA